MGSTPTGETIWLEKKQNKRYISNAVIHKYLRPIQDALYTVHMREKIGTKDPCFSTKNLISDNDDEGKKSFPRILGHEYDEKVLEFLQKACRFWMITEKQTFKNIIYDKKLAWSRCSLKGDKYTIPNDFIKKVYKEVFYKENF